MQNLRQYLNKTFLNKATFHERWNNVMDVGHRVAVNAILITSCYAGYLGYNEYQRNKEYQRMWAKNNKYYEYDPFYMYNPEYMRKNNVDEEMITKTRPEHAAARAIREIYRLPMQPPYEALPLAVAVNGNPIREGPDCNMPEFMSPEQRAKWEAKMKEMYNNNTHPSSSSSSSSTTSTSSATSSLTPSK